MFIVNLLVFGFANPSTTTESSSQEQVSQKVDNASGGRATWYAPGVKDLFGVKAVVPLWSEDFESGSMPAGWTVLDGNSDGYQWIVVDSATWGHGDRIPPDHGSYFAGYDDDDAGSNTSTDEELISPATEVAGLDSLLLIYSYYYNWLSSDSFAVNARFHDGSSWSSWDTLVLYGSDVGGWDTLNLSGYLPAESVQVEFTWYDHTGSHWDWYVSVDNISLMTFVPDYDLSLEIQPPAGAIPYGDTASPPVVLRNTGANPITTDFNVTMRIMDEHDVLVYDETVPVTHDFAPGETLTVSMPDWVPGEVGPHFATAFHDYSDDLPQNDTDAVVAFVVKYSYRVPYTSNPPTIDGSIDTVSEWAGVQPLLIGDFMGSFGNPNPSEAVLFYATHDDNYLYMAFDARADTSFSDHSQPTIGFDDDNSKTYPASPDTSEGFNGIGSDNGWYKDVMQDNGAGPVGMGWDSIDMSGEFAFGTGTGHHQMEARVAIVDPTSDIGPQTLFAGPVWPDTVGAMIYWFDISAPDGQYAWWPQDVSSTTWYYPDGFGELILESNTGSQENAGTRTQPRLMAASAVKGQVNISLVLPSNAHISVGLYDVSGRLVKKLADENARAGLHRFSAEPGNAGVFFVRAVVGDKVLSQKVSVVK